MAMKMNSVLLVVPSRSELREPATAAQKMRSAEAAGSV